MVLCAEKPTIALLKRVSIELPIQLKKITEEHQYAVSIAAEESAVLVTDDTITVKVFLTSPLLRDPQGIYAQPFSVRIYQRFLAGKKKQIKFTFAFTTRPMRIIDHGYYSISSYQFQLLFTNIACQPQQPNGIYLLFIFFIVFLFIIFVVQTRQSAEK